MHITRVQSKNDLVFFGILHAVQNSIIFHQCFRLRQEKGLWWIACVGIFIQHNLRRVLENLKSQFIAIINGRIH
ncbi:MAG: heparan-alpha-glucosaminide N-acetyltransferase domain-containing protein [Anaerolineaceae bacterium]